VVVCQHQEFKTDQQIRTKFFIIWNYALEPTIRQYSTMPQ